MLLAEGMLGNKGRKLDRDGLVELIKDIKKNTKLSDEDAAVIAASKVTSLHLHRRVVHKDKYFQGCRCSAQVPHVVPDRSY